ncbi:MAG TPA: hypothetical protein VLA79_11200 [Polyangia bacterium]|nr:hypothetical protein [Polyangia bacterium]
MIQKRGSCTGAEAELAQLIEACEPVVISDVRKRRSLSAVYSRHHERRRTVRFGLRAAMTVGVLLMAGAATAAVFGVRFRLLASTPTPIASAPAPAVRHVARRAELAPIAELEASAEPESPPELAPPAPPVHRARALKSEDPSLVVSAIRALRQDRDPERAGRLLAAYLRTHPRGALAEEAVALSIEAADARHSPAAATFAERYLKEYPHGRFRSAAERVLARPAL